MFDKILIANRGEIACRILRTVRRLGMRTVAVYSDADKNALHVALADEAVAIGPAPAAESYLRGNVIVDVARRCGAQAIHPGYGFLAENAEFAEACDDAGVIFVGPPAAAIRLLGDKGAAKAAMAKAGVPVLPGEDGADTSARARAAAKRVGYPLLIKPVSGGGGKGMRVVDEPAGLAEALAASRREAKAAFGDGRLLLERYLDRPRHIEIQVFADCHGNVVHLFERDCSVQRRHQKVVEEAPAPDIDTELRDKMAAAAIAATRSAGYVGAGTVEFLVDRDGGFYFLEMNTRLQVEHAVTELLTGHDLVEWQLRVADGEPLPCAQDEIEMRGHAIEARIYAENPAVGFLPSTGRFDHLRMPGEGRHIRIDSGVREGDTVGIHYDPLIAKLIAWDEDRAGAIDRLRDALGGFQIVGPSSNLDFLRAVVSHPSFLDGPVDTGFIDRNRDALTAAPGATPNDVLVLACLDLLTRRADAAAERSRDRHSPWHASNGWRLNHESQQSFHFLDGEVDREAEVHFVAGGYRVELAGKFVEARGQRSAEGDIIAEIDGESRIATVVERHRDVTVFFQGSAHRLILHDPLDAETKDIATGGSLTAPLPGRVIAVMIEPGVDVARGDPLMIVEAMKMEHTITAPADGRVERVNFATGALVEEGVELLSFAVESEP